MTTRTHDHLTVATATFDELVLQSDQPVLVDFWAPWCGPCRAVKPTLERLASDYRGRVRIAFVNVDENPELAERFTIRSIPALRLFKGGTLVDGMNGAGSRDQLVDFLDKAL